MSETLHTAVYEDGHLGRATHPQMDSGLGFTCDEEILPFILAFHSAGIKTLSSCQSGGPWLIPRRSVVYTHDDPQVVLKFALYLRDAVPGKSGWQNQIRVDHYHVPDCECFSVLEFTSDFDTKMLTAIESFHV